MKIILCLLCGLPASGKTTICKKLCKIKSEVIHVSFDELIGKLDLEIDKWKLTRNDVIRLIKIIVESLLNEKEINLNVSKEFSLLNMNSLNKLISDCNLINRENDDMVVILVDDNMYLKSMRKKIYQIAEEFTISFLLLYISCSLEICKQRNKIRSDSILVNDEVIENINKQMEIPKDEFINIFEVDTNNLDNIEDIVENIFSTIKNCSKFLIKSKRISPNELYKREENKKINLNNIIHQADLCIRRFITKCHNDDGEILTDVRNQVKINMKAVGKAKKYIIHEIKKENLSLLNHHHFIMNEQFEKKVVKLLLDYLKIESTSILT